MIDSGAHFFKTDLQVHTPRDPAWSGKRPVSDGERAAYAEAFVAACRERGLQAVAVTDHHDFAFVDHIRSAALQEAGADGKPLPASQRLVVFPGLELTLPVPCQALLIFSADFPSERLPAVLNALAIEPAEDSAEKAKVPEQLAVDLKALHDRLDETSWLRGQYIVFPNVTDGGYRTLIRSGMRQPYREMPCVGGYIDGGAAIGDGNRRIFAGEDQNWGNKRVAVIRTSDSRAESFEKLGVHPTWIKWAEPTAEALRQACLAEESRITVEAPRLPIVVVTRLSVSNSRFMGPVDLNLNPQYNALIGGRGTGKSTCLEYLRWALCDQQRPRDLDSSELPDHAARRGRLVEQTLKPVDGQVEVEFLLSGTPHLVRRYASTGEVMLKVGEAELTTATPEDVRSLLPIEAYSQRQLSSIGVRESELTRFVTAPLRTQLDAIGVETDQTAVKIRENHARLSRFRDLSGTLRSRRSDGNRLTSGSSPSAKSSRAYQQTTARPSTTSRDSIAPPSYGIHGSRDLNGRGMPPMPQRLRSPLPRTGFAPCLTGPKSQSPTSHPRWRGKSKERSMKLADARRSSQPRWKPQRPSEHRPRRHAMP